MMMLVILALFGASALATALYGVRRAALALIVLRPGCDKAFEAVKQVLGAASGPGAALNLLVIALAAVGLAMRPRALLNGIVIGWLCVLAAAFASMAHSSDPAAGLRLFLTLLTYASVAAIPFVLVDSPEAAGACLKAALLSSVIPAAWGLFELASKPEILLGDERLESTFTHSNILAFYLVGVLTLMLYMMSSRMPVLPAELRRRYGGWLLAYGGLLVLLLLATKTRSAWIAMLLVLGGHALANDRRWLLGIFALPLALLIPGIGERVLDLGSGNTNDAFANLNSYAWRQLLWAETWEWLRQNPSMIFGHGLDLYVPHVPLFFSRGANPEGIGAHNAVLQVYFEMGLLGIGGFLVLFGATLVQLLRRLTDDPPGALLMLLLTLAHMLVAYSDNLLDYLQFQWFFWFTIATVIASNRFLSPRRAAVRPVLRPLAAAT